METSKRRQTTCDRGAELPSPVWTLPVEILLQIAARSDAITLVRLDAACKLLHREILTMEFVSRVCSVPPGLLPTRLHSYLNKTFCLPEHPADASPLSTHKNAVGFVSRSSWSWEALCTRRQDDYAKIRQDAWRKVMKTFYINKHILGT